MTTLSITLARSSDGSVDEAGTLDACRAAVRKYVAERETETSQIADAVGALFDRLAGGRANMPYVQSSVLHALNAQPENFKVLGEKIAQYVRDNAGDRESGKLFHIGKGKTGGVTRWSDQPLPAPESK